MLIWLPCSANYVMMHRQYAIATKKQALPLSTRIQNMDAAVSKGHFVSIQDAKELLRAINNEKPSASEYLQAIKFFGMLIPAGI